MSAYDQDVLTFASSFLSRCGFMATVPRSAPVGSASHEQRNKAMLEASFLRERFTEELEATLSKCGVRLAVCNNILL